MRVLPVDPCNQSSPGCDLSAESCELIAEASVNSACTLPCSSSSRPLCIAGALNLLLQRHPINSALSLIVVMVSLAVLYLLLGAEFLAAAQVIVYSGAIMVLFTFVIMLLNAGEEDRSKSTSRIASAAGFPRRRRPGLSSSPSCSSQRSCSWAVQRWATRLFPLQRLRVCSSAICCYLLRSPRS